MEQRLKSHYESLSRAIEFTSSADKKAAPALVLQLALVGTLAARSERYTPIFSQATWGWEPIIFAVVMGIYGVLFVAIVAVAASVYLPRTPRSGDSLIYFEDISTMPYEEFESQAREITPAAIERQLLQQIHTVSRIASAKMNRVRWIYLLSAPSVALWIVLLLWGSV